MAEHMVMKKLPPEDTRKLFWSFGTCSRTLYFILDRALDAIRTVLERVSGDIPEEGALSCADLLAALTVGKDHKKGEDHA